MTQPRAREAEAGPVDPRGLRWFLPAFVAEDPEREAWMLGLAFRIRERWFLIPADLPAEVSPALFCARLPFTRPWCLGLANFRGELVPVHDLGALLDDGRAVPGRYFLMLGRRDARACLSIDEITVATIPADVDAEIQRPLPNLPEDLVCRGVAVGPTTYIEIDLGGLLSILAQRAGRL